jgi:spermidine/putrescine transport system ATP-binding protein
MDESTIELKSVSKEFGTHLVVREISLKIKRGEFFSLLGPSGCGKTTTLRMIAGLDNPTSGEIFIGGRLANGAPPYARDVNLVFQSYALFPHMTVFQNVAFGLEMKKILRAQVQSSVEETLSLVRLTGLESRYPKQLSGGQQQRVALARALVTHPAVLLLDEPLGALDLKLRKEMQLELKKLQRKLNLTFVYVTHDQEEALTMSDRIAIMHRGRVIQIGRPEEIYEQPATRFVADFIGETNFIEGKIIASEPPLVTLDVQGIKMRALGVPPYENGREVIIAIRPEKIWLAKESTAQLENHFTGLIEELVYFGTDTRYLVRLGGDLVLSVRQQNLDHSAYRRGDRVYLGWPSQGAQVLHSEPES